MEGTIPHDLASLKRPALQKLCKKFGIKANKKNVDLIKALEELRDSTGLVSHNDESISHLSTKLSPQEVGKSPLQSNTIVPSPDFHQDLEVLDSPSKKYLSHEDKKGDRDKRHRSGDNNSEYSISAQSLITCHSGDTPLSLSGVSCGSSEPWLTLSTELPNLPKPEDHDFGSCFDNVQESLPHNINSSKSHTGTPVCKSEYAPNQSCETEVKASDSDSCLPVCDEESSIAPFSPPVSNQELPSDSKRKRNHTYTLDTFSSEENKTDECENEKPPLKRMRRETFSVSPKIIKINKCENVVSSTDDNAGSNTNEAETLSGIVDVHTEIMNLLDKRVEEKLANSNYMPVFSSSENQPKPSTATKFDSAHKKQFSRMRSIVSYQRDKEKRSSSVRSGDIPYAAKKPKLTEKQPTITSKIPKATFKPSVMTVNHTSFNFTDKKSMKSNTANAGVMSVVTSVNEPPHKSAKLRKSTALTKTPGKSAGSDRKTFMFNATSAKKTHFNINESLKKKTAYKPHIGKLPDFKISKY